MKKLCVKGIQKFKKKKKKKKKKSSLADGK